MPTAAEQLVGRSAELGSLDAALGALERGAPAVLELVGEPGIGKTRLLGELRARAEARGQLVLTGSASELERELPFSVFVDALDQYVQALEPRRLAALGDDTRAEVAQVLPSIPAAGAATAGLADERYRTHRAVRRLLELLAEDKPLVLLLDDLHWADSGSIELLGSLLRHPPVGPVLIAMAVRPRQTPERLSMARERALRAGTLNRLELGALTAAETRELLGAGVSSGVAAALYDESGGNPFYLQQLARALDRRLAALPTVADVSLDGVDAPRTVTAALTEELALLDDVARRALEGAAVAGDPFELDLAAAAASLPEPEAIEALDELLRRDLVRTTDVPRRFGFRHPLVRQAVYAAAPGGWRLGAHERCSEALAARGAAATARAHHVEQAARFGDAGAIAVLREAGAAVAQRSPAGAAHWFAAALRLQPADAPAGERTALLRALAQAQAATGQFADARSALLDAMEITPGDVGLAAACARVEQLIGRHDDAQARLERSLAELGDPASRDAVTVMIALAIGGVFRLDFCGARDWGARALEVARPLGERSLTAAATALLACGSSLVGTRADADRQRSEAAALVDAMPDGELALRLEAAAYLAAAESYLERFEEAWAHAERALAVARTSGQGEQLPILFPVMATVTIALGRMADGAELLDGAIEGARLAGTSQALAWQLMNRSIVAILAGDVDLAIRCSDEAVALARDIDEGMVSSYAGVALGLALMEAGDDARGVELTVASGGGEELPAFGGGWRAWFLERLTGGWLALGRRAEAERAAAAATAVAETTGLRHPKAMADRAAALVALDAGDARAAVELAFASAAAAAELGARVEAGLARTVAGRALAAAGDADRAAAELERAAAELEACGALRYRSAAERELGKLGRRRSRKSRQGRAGATGIDALTERELQIARLVVDRKTNAEIAAELFLGVKTIETHLRNLFHKLEVSSRVEVARVVERADRAGSTR